MSLEDYEWPERYDDEDAEKLSTGARAADDDDLDDLSDAAHPRQMTPARATRYYDRIRRKISHRLKKGGKATGKAGEFLLFAPDVFILLWRLVQDPRVSMKNKVLLGTAIAYYLLPMDILPEAIVGVMGYLDDLILGVYVLNKVLTDTDESILREHWSGEADLLAFIRKVLDAADSLVPPETVKKLRRIAKD